MIHQNTDWRKNIFSIDPGNTTSGICTIISGKILYAENIESRCVMDKIIDGSKNNRFMVLIEDIGPYQVRLSQQTIDTCKFIGELEYRLKEAAIDYRKILRWQVKKWVYVAFNNIAEPRIIEKIRKKNQKTRLGEDRKPSFVYVDDRIVIAAMKKLWDIPTPKPGKTNQYGIKSHSWQSLAVASFYIASL